MQKRYLTATDIVVCQNISYERYLKLFISTKKEFDRRIKYLHCHGGYFCNHIVKVARGVPSFVVVGDSACLGVDKDKFMTSGELYSQNIDSSLQFITMLTSVVSFWNLVLLPLCYDDDEDG